MDHKATLRDHAEGRFGVSAFVVYAHANIRSICVSKKAKTIARKKKLPHNDESFPDIARILLIF